VSAKKQQQQDAKSAPAAAGESLLEQAIAATKRTERNQAESMLRALVGEAMKGQMKWNRGVSKTITAAMEQLDAMISKQLGAIMHAPEFLRIEGSWRGLHYLVNNTETNAQLKVKVLNCGKKELHKDLSKAVEFDQSNIFKKIYENEFGTPGGEPYAALIGDYEITSHPDDIDLLTHMSNVSAAAFAPFVTSAGAEMFGFESYDELSRPRDLEKIFDSSEYAKWNAFRNSEDSRFVTLTMPRALARMPYGAKTRPIEEFAFEEFERKGDHAHYCWMSAAYVMGARLTSAYSKHGWCTAIRGAEGGGKVEDLPMHVFTSDDGDADMKCPTEIGITDRREAELSKLGFLPLCHYKNTNYAVFFGAQTCQKAKKFDKPEATANAAISARLPYLMACSRFAHYLKVMARDKIGSMMEIEDVEDWLNKWINQYILRDEKPTQELKAKFPLAEARVQVQEVAGAPGSYNAVAWLRPWLQLEELTSSMRMVARIPKAAA
jgi:type VI secretion system protein ImpC